MSDVRQKAKDLLRLALHDGTGPEERSAATTQLLRLIDKYDLLSAGGKPINVASDILKKIVSMDIADVANHAEQFASGFERVMAASKRITDRVGGGGGGSEPRRRRRYR